MTLSVTGGRYAPTDLWQYWYKQHWQIASPASVSSIN